MSRYIRRLDRKNDVDQGQVNPRVFRPRPSTQNRPVESEISFYQIPANRDEEDFLDEFLAEPWLKSGDIPGLCILEDKDFQELKLDPPALKEVSEPFGKYHCEIADPGEQKATELSNKVEILREFQRKSKK